MAESKETRGELERRFAETIKKMLFSNETADWFKGEATTGQLAAVCSLVDHELDVREANKRVRLLKNAKFPTLKSFDDFDFSDVALPDDYSADDMRSLDFIEMTQDFVFYGSCGRGKTHLATALGVLAVQSLMSVRFFETAPLVLKLKTANADGTLDKLLAQIAKADLLILDEFGYIPIDIEGARLLSQVMTATYETRSMIITTNIEFSKWGTVLGDDHLAEALCDRIFHHGRLVEFGGQSKRLDNSLMMGKGKN